MSDFFQDGTVATLHDFGTASLSDTTVLLEKDGRHITLVLPCGARDLDNPAFHRIVEALHTATFLHRVIIGLDGSSREEAEHLTTRCAALPQDVRVLWNGCSGTGKGRNLGLSVGEALEAGTDIIVAHDCDILDYSLNIPARLCAAIADSQHGFLLSKGFSARFSTQMNGRVTRLLFFPLLQTAQEVWGNVRLVRFLSAFRYPLSGEFAVRAQVVEQWKFASDWGVEIQLLTEAYRTLRPAQICQVDIADCYDHRHQDLSPHNPDRGLNRMAFEVARGIIQSLAGEGFLLDLANLENLQAGYLQRAKDSLVLYAADARLNALTYPTADEAQAVATFGEALQRAISAFLASNSHKPQPPAWAASLPQK